MLSIVPSEALILLPGFDSEETYVFVDRGASSFLCRSCKSHLERRSSMVIPHTTDRLASTTDGDYIIIINNRTSRFAGREIWNRRQKIFGSFIFTQWVIRPWRNVKLFEFNTKYSNVTPQPNRIYFLEDPDGNALKWCAQIEDVSRHYFDTSWTCLYAIIVLVEEYLKTV